MNFLSKILTFVRNKIYGYLFQLKTNKNVKNKIINFNDFKIGIKKNNDGLNTIKFREGFKIFIKNKDLNCLAETCINNDYLKNKNFLIKKDDIVFDIGAHIGSFSILAANKGAYVYAFEPEKNNYKQLLENIKINNMQEKIFPFNFGIYSENKEIKLHKSNNTGGHSIIYNSNLSDNDENFQLINLKTLKNILDELKLDRIDLLKIDIEGSEYDIFEKLSNEVYKKINKIVGEYHLFQNSKFNYKNLKNTLSKKYYKVKKYSPYYFIAYNKKPYDEK